MFDILLAISIRKIALFVVHNWVIFAIVAFVVCGAMIVWLIREVLKSGDEDDDEDSDESPVAAKADEDKGDVGEKAVEPKIVDAAEPALQEEEIDVPQETPQQVEAVIPEVSPEPESPEVPDEIGETKEPEPIAETEDLSPEPEPETVEEFGESDSLDELLDDEPGEIVEELPEPGVVEAPIVIPKAKNEVVEAGIVKPEAKADKASKKLEKQRAKEEKQRLKAQQKEAKKQKKDKKSKRGKKGKSFDFSSPDLITEADYRLVTQRILKIKQKSNKSILFAAAARNSLPITIPVNIAIQLAEDKHRCLLIDLDLKRNAIAKAFDIEDKPNPKRLRPMPYPTPIKELFVWPAHNFTRSGHMNIIPLARAAVEKFDYVLISAPYLTGSPDRVQIANAAGFSFIFTQDLDQAELLNTIIELTDCQILANYQVTG